MFFVAFIIFNYQTQFMKSKVRQSGSRPQNGLRLRTKLDSCFGGNRFYAVDSRFRLPGRLLLHERRGLIFLFLSSVARG